MNKSKIAISISKKILDLVDRFVLIRHFTNRSQAIEEAVEEKLERLERTRLARECSKLDPTFEKAMVEEGLSEHNTFGAVLSQVTLDKYVLFMHIYAYENYTKHR